MDIKFACNKMCYINTISIFGLKKSQKQIPDPHEVMLSNNMFFKLQQKIKVVMSQASYIQTHTQYDCKHNYSFSCFSALLPAFPAEIRIGVFRGECLD